MKMSIMEIFLNQIVFLMKSKTKKSSNINTLKPNVENYGKCNTGKEYPKADIKITSQINKCLSSRIPSFGCDRCDFQCVEKSGMVYGKDIHHEY